MNCLTSIIHKDYSYLPGLRSFCHYHSRVKMIYLIKTINYNQTNLWIFFFQQLYLIIQPCIMDFSLLKAIPIQNSIKLNFTLDHWRHARSILKAAFYPKIFIYGLKTEKINLYILLSSFFSLLKFYWFLEVCPSLVKLIYLKIHLEEKKCEMMIYYAEI